MLILGLWDGFFYENLLLGMAAFVIYRGAIATPGEKYDICRDQRAKDFNAVVSCAGTTRCTR